MKATLGGGELRKTVLLPEGEDLNEWIAVNSVHFYNAANMIYGTCTEFCTEESCPVMSAGPKYEYLWKDGVKYKKPTKVSAPVYIDNLLNWVNEQISNPALFPVDESAKFPRNFIQQVRQIYKRLFRLYAHIYYSHIDKIRQIGANAHLNTCFKHFVFFILEFKLVDPEELAPLKKLIAKFTKDAEI
jgi:MOB kinase activator 1